MQGYDAASYGDGIAEVYDSWYAELPDRDECVAALAALAGGGRVLELGVGTGRLALPLVERGLEVHGVDASTAMVERLRAKPGGEQVHVLVGDMAGPLPAGPFAVAFVAFNTFFNLTSLDDQRRCVASVAGALAPGGRFVVEASVPDDAPAGDAIEVRRLDVDRVVLLVSRNDPATRRSTSQLIDISERGVRLRPMSLRMTTPDELDDLATEAGLVLEHRWGGWRDEPFDETSDRHVSVYRRGTPATA